MKSETIQILKKVLGNNVIELFYRSLGFLSDERYLRLMFRLRMGKKLSLDNPKTFCEKLQWLKLYDHNPLYTTLVDKIEVKKYVESVIGPDHIIKTIRCWESFDEIDFDVLPEQFVLKCNHDSGGLCIVRDKSLFNVKEAKKTIDRSLRRSFYKNYREWAYKGISPKVFAEEYLDAGEEGLTDYKFFCFNGEPKFINVSRFEHTDDEEISFYSLDWKETPFQRVDHKRLSIVPSRPHCLDEMIEISRKLSNGIPFVRVDLYENNDKVYFGEMTLCPSAGFAKYGPENWNETLGDWIKLPSVRANQ